MSLLNKEEKTTIISPVIESKKWSYTPSDFANIMEDDIVRQKWEDYIRIVNKKTLLKEWLQEFCSILPNFVQGADIIKFYDNRILTLNILIQEKVLIQNLLTVTCILDEDYPEELIEKIIQDSKHSGASSDID